MENLKQQIQKILSHNVLIDEDVRENILENLETFDNEKLARILEILTRADQKQTEVFRQVLETNPEFFGDVKQIVKKEHSAILKRKEATSQEEEKSILEELEAEIDSLPVNK